MKPLLNHGSPWNNHPDDFTALPLSLLTLILSGQTQKEARRKGIPDDASHSGQPPGAQNNMEKYNLMAQNSGHLSFIPVKTLWNLSICIFGLSSAKKSFPMVFPQFLHSKYTILFWKLYYIVFKMNESSFHLPIFLLHFPFLCILCCITSIQGKILALSFSLPINSSLMPIVLQSPLIEFQIFFSIIYLLSKISKLSFFIESYL